jgi:hypothetical protein
MGSKLKEFELGIKLLLWVFEQSSLQEGGEQR